MSLFRSIQTHLAITGLLGSELLIKKQHLARTPEPQVSDDEEQVEAYNKAALHGMAPIYAVCLEIIQHFLPQPPNSVADLCCGPGHFTNWLNQELSPKTIYGVDLAQNMLEHCKKNVPVAQCVLESVTELKSFDDHSIDLTVMLSGLHHMPNKEIAIQALAQMERITNPNGLILFYDLLRLKTLWQTNFYTHFLGVKHIKGVEAFQKDFELSMLAAWSREELRSFVPKSNHRDWYGIKGFGTSSTEFIIGVPKGTSPRSWLPKERDPKTAQRVTTDFLPQYNGLRSIVKNSRFVKI